LTVVSLSTNRRKWIVLVVFLVVVVLGFLGAIVFFFPPRKEYVVLREIPVTTYYVRNATSTATLSRTVVTSSSFLSTVTRESVILRIITTGVINGTLGLLSYTTQTMALWTSYNQTIVSTTTITSTSTSASTYTRTVWTTVTAPPGAAISSPNDPGHTRGFVELILCSVLVTGMLVFRRRSTSHNHVKRCV